MVLEGLSGSLRGTLQKIANAAHMNKAMVKEIVHDVQVALLRADVNVMMVKGLTEELERRALEEKPDAGVSSKEHVIHILYEELVKILGKKREIPLKKQKIMMVGLYGQGKTTTTGKLAKYFQRKGMSVAVIAADVHRPAAYDQLKQLAESINVPIYGEPGQKDAVKVVKDGLKKLDDYDIVIIDTAGRHALEDDLIDEMSRIFKAADPDEKFLVLDAAVGQQAGPQAKAFHDAVKITGVVITKLDGTAKGGGALSAVSVTKAPIVFIGVGERIDDLEPFDPPRFISRMLGMGDLQTLLEKAEEEMDQETAEATARKMMSGKFTLSDMEEQMEQLTKMGPLQKVMDMLPFGGQKIDQAHIEDLQLKLQNFRIIMCSMTEDEKEDPKIVKASRVKRIARGAGVDQREVKALLKYYNMSQKTMKGFSSNRKLQKKLMKQLNIQDMQ